MLYMPNRPAKNYKEKFNILERKRRDVGLQSWSN